MRDEEKRDKHTAFELGSVLWTASDMVAVRVVLPLVKLLRLICRRLLMLRANDRLANELDTLSGTSRTGFAPAIQCASCGDRATTPDARIIPSQKLWAADSDTSLLRIVRGPTLTLTHTVQLVPRIILQLLHQFRRETMRMTSRICAIRVDGSKMSRKERFRTWVWWIELRDSIDQSGDSSSKFTRGWEPQWAPSLGQGSPRL